MFLNVKFIQITMSEVSTGQFFQKPLNFFFVGNFLISVSVERVAKGSFLSLRGKAQGLILKSVEL